MLSRLRKIDRMWIGMMVAAAVAIAGPLGLAVGFHSHPIGHHSHPVPVYSYVYASKTVDSRQVRVGETTGYTVMIRNSGGTATTVTEVIDTLPLGFEYLPGSTSGALLADPVVDGRKLRWKARKALGGSASFSFHFDVRVSRRPGVYRNVVDVRATKPSIVEGSGPTAPVYVGVPTELEAVAALMKDGSLRLKLSARLTSSGRPVAGQPVTFTTTDSPLTYCMAYTNGNGVAECTGAQVLAGTIASLGYEAAFEPWSGIYGPAWDHGDLIE